MTEPKLNMEGDGDPNCTICGGRGVVNARKNNKGMTITKPCKCVVIRDLLLNIKKRWPALLKAKKVKQSPLKDKTHMDLHITAKDDVFKAQMRHVALRKGPDWNFCVATDKDLVNAWLAVAKAEGRQILDRDVASSTIKYMTLEDLVDPPDLLVIILGVKSAQNRQMSAVLLEAIQSRSYQGKATWVVDTPTQPLAPGHMCYSRELEELMSSWKPIRFGKTSIPRPRPTTPSQNHYRSSREDNDEEDTLLTGKKKNKNNSWKRK